MVPLTTISASPAPHLLNPDRIVNDRTLSVIHFMTAKRHLELREVRASIGSIYNAISLYGGNVKYYYLAIRATATLGNFCDAIDMATKVLVSFPHDPELRLLRAECHFNNRDWFNGLADLYSVLEKDPENGKALHLLRLVQALPQHA